MSTLYDAWEKGPNAENEYFHETDEMLENGGQVGLDAAGFIPVLGSALSGVQAFYHGAHAVNDVQNGDYRSATSQGVQALWNGVNALPPVHHALHGVHAAEGLYDLVTGVENAGNEEKGNHGEHIPTAAQTAGDMVARLFCGEDSDEERAEVEKNKEERADEWSRQQLRDWAQRNGKKIQE
jgi:hypothetical protein